MSETVLNQEERKLNSKESPEQKKNRYQRMNRILGIVLSIIMIGLTAFVLKLQHENSQILGQSNDVGQSSAEGLSNNYRSYVKQYKDTKAQLEETTRKLEAVTLQLNDVTAQLETTKGLLTQTQTMLAQAQAENTKLKEDLQNLDGIRGTDSSQITAQGAQNISELEARIASLKTKNTQAAAELSDLKGQLHAFQADFSTVEEGRSLIVLFQSKIKLVKSRMRYLEQEAYFARIAAQKERDRIAALNGNNGFVLRNGVYQKPNPTNKTFSIDVKMVQ